MGEVSTRCWPLFVIKSFGIVSAERTKELQVHLPSECPSNFRKDWVGKIPWRRKRQPTPVFLPGESQGQRNLVGYSPWGCKESDMTEGLSLHFTLRNTPLQNFSHLLLVVSPNISQEGFTRWLKALTITEGNRN